MNAVIVSAKIGKTILVVHHTEEGMNVIVDDPVRGAYTVKPSFVLKHSRLLKTITATAVACMNAHGVEVEEPVEYGG